jgi:3-deoxy-D-manno-octulosonic-acid transferase
MFFLYSLALGLALLVSAPWWLVQMLRHGKYRAGWHERWGRVPERILRGADGRDVIWVHAVSVGEVLAVAGLINELRRWGGCRVLVSTTTATGQKLAAERFGAEHVFFFPLDFGFAIRPYLEALRPKLVVVAETEFWPNFLRLAQASGARIATVNARISDRSFPRYRRMRTLMRAVLAPIDLFLAQTGDDAQRLVQIGAPATRVQTSGNLKFDYQPKAEPAIVADFRQAMTRAGAGPVVVCGSTVEGEEEPVVAAWQSILARFPRAVMVLAPRRPERFGAVAEILTRTGMSFCRRSAWDGRQPPVGGVFLLDTIGELGAMYALADVAFVGGSLAPRGGHNILEPAYFGAPILVGPHTENFRDIVATFRRRQAVLTVHDGNELAASLARLLGNAEERRQLGACAAAVMQANAGATGRTLAALRELLALPPGAAREAQP